jgi:hypothetical protein
VHHIHHLCSRIPYYRLPSVLRDHPELGGTGGLAWRRAWAVSISSVMTGVALLNRITNLLRNQNHESNGGFPPHPSLKIAISLGE